MSPWMDLDHVRFDCWARPVDISLCEYTYIIDIQWANPTDVFKFDSNFDPISQAQGRIMYLTIKD